MVGQAFEQDTDNQVLSQVRVGMSVYDEGDEQIGTVKDLYMGASSPKAEARGEGSVTAPARETANTSLVDDIARGLSSANLPEELQQRMLREGFVTIDTGGLFSKRLYALTEHIKSVDSEHVHLRVPRTNLIQRD